MKSFAWSGITTALTLLVVLAAASVLPVRSAEYSSRQLGTVTSTSSEAQSSAISKESPGASASEPIGISTTTASDTNMGRDGKPLSPELTALGEKVRHALAVYEPKHLNARDNSCWEVMHGLIAFGPRTEIFRDGPGGQTVNAMGWLCWGARCQGAPLIVLENEHPHALYGVGLEGHDGQYLAMLAQWKVIPNSPMHIGGKDFTVADFIEEEKLTCMSGTELTFKLIALAHYLPSDAQWTSRYGEQWNIPKLLKAEIESPVNGATCGGSHRLFGIANAVKERTKRGEPIDGQWARAAKYISDYHRYTLGTLQNPDGSFSTEWFNFAADRPGDIDRKLQTTGHMLEFLVWSLPEEQLRDPKVIKTVNFLADTLLANPDHPWSIGPLGHGLHALMIYHQRMYNQPPLPPVSLTAAEPLKTKAKTISSALNPPDPECDGEGNLSISQLLRAAERAKSPHPEDGASNSTEKKAAAKAASDKLLADQADGCTDSIPPKATPAPGLKVAERELLPAVPSTARPSAAPQASDGASTSSDAPWAPTDAPFDRPGTPVVGP